MYQLIAYLKFLLKSNNQHGVHSPFVYNLVTKCFYDTSKHDEYNAIASYRDELLKNDNVIKITDFGSGSKVFKSDNRSIKAIAKTSGTTSKNTKLLFRMVRYFQPRHILELGTNLGIGTQAMALANPDANIITIEGCPEILKVATHLFSNKNFTNIHSIQGSFQDKIQELSPSKWDFIFFDGHHSKEATLAYFEMLLPTAHNNSVFIFDDIYWSKGMTDAWKIIKEHPQVTVTVDTFNWGIVFFRKEQPKEHFKIRV
ncbi:methyltransferase family protein [Gelidibacter algens]|uniref:Methyltransferase family protein n=1 Tax=Gelidibacter algens TaxID=49280 RepID=A0A1A7R124_9FLAO|nr:class I SAM-dependent methyltransferase [Gelidibacter algens]OBX25955.1 methyltransferase [Gelidibacter algens]RAJ25241.1 methyltransferase family protein [Gelidibacter algens]